MHASKTTWRNRIVRHAEVAPDQLLANSKNWRVHPKHQRDALAGVVDEVGWVQEIIVQDGTDTVVDGHLRVSLALERSEPVIPVTYVDLEDHEVDLVLATLDPLAAMATTDTEKLDELLRDVQTGEAAVQEMLAELAESAGVTPPEVDAPEDFGSYGDDIETDYCCPRCSYEWSGQPR
jgi:hypothetical protein